MKTLEGQLVAPKTARFCIVASRFNHFIVDKLLEGAMDALTRHGANMESVTVVRVPGAWEIPVAVQRAARSKKFDAIITLGAVIRGSTTHFDHVAGEVSKGIAHAQIESGLPILFGVLTTDTIEQAIERAGTKLGNKGFDAAVSAIEMVSLGTAMKDEGF
jgi:6,7-dimethyl-8-ribityllumazine synthase